MLPESCPPDEFAPPSPADEHWFIEHFGTADDVPDEEWSDTTEFPAVVVPIEPDPETDPRPADNGQPRTLRGTIDDEVRAYREWRTPAGELLADTLERLSQLVRWTGATTPAEYFDRMEVWEESIYIKEFDRGWSEGVESVRRELSPYLPEQRPC